MQQVRIHRKRRFAALVLGNRNLVFLSEIKQFRPAGQIPFPPRRDHLDIRVQRISGQFETNLIVALARRPMRHRIRTGFFGDLDKTL